MSDDALIEIAARTAFSYEQCDRRQAAMLEENWNRRLSDEDRAEYRALASAILANVEPIIRADERRQVILDGEAGIVYRDLEADIRLDERRRIDTAISHIDLPTPVEGDSEAHMYALGFTTMWEIARKIARNGGRDEATS